MKFVTFYEDKVFASKLIDMNQKPQNFNFDWMGDGQSFELKALEKHPNELIYSEVEVTRYEWRYLNQSDSVNMKKHFA